MAHLFKVLNICNTWSTAKCTKLVVYSCSFEFRTDARAKHMHLIHQYKPLRLTYPVSHFQCKEVFCCDKTGELPCGTTLAPRKCNCDSNNSSFYACTSWLSTVFLLQNCVNPYFLFPLHKFRLNREYHYCHGNNSNQGAKVVPWYFRPVTIPRVFLHSFKLFVLECF